MYSKKNINIQTNEHRNESVLISTFTKTHACSYTGLQIGMDLINHSFQAQYEIRAIVDIKSYDKEAMLNWMPANWLILIFQNGCGGPFINARASILPPGIRLISQVISKLIPFISGLLFNTWWILGARYPQFPLKINSNNFSIPLVVKQGPCTGYQYSKRHATCMKKSG